MVIGPRRAVPGMVAGLSLANQRRDTIVDELACPLLWSGPLEFLNATWERAPDLWSIRGMAYRVEVPARAAAESPLWAGVIAREAPERLRETLRAAREQGDREVIARLSVQLAEALLAAGEYLEAAEVIDEARTDAPLAEKARRRMALLRARAATALGDASAARGAHRRGGGDGRRSRAAGLVRGARRHGAREPGDRRGPLGGEAAYEEALVAARRQGGDRRNEAVALADLGIAELALGNGEVALGHLEDARAMLRDVGDRRSEARSLLHLRATRGALRRPRRRRVLRRGARAGHPGPGGIDAGKRGSCATWRGRISTRGTRRRRARTR